MAELEGYLDIMRETSNLRLTGLYSQIRSGIPDMLEGLQAIAWKLC
jgi:hypothetical protein